MFEMYPDYSNTIKLRIIYAVTEFVTGVPLFAVKKALSFWMYYLIRISEAHIHDSEKILVM